MADQPQRMLTVKEVAAEISISVYSVHTLIRSGKLRAVNVSLNAHTLRPRWRVSRADLKAFLQTRQNRTPERAKPHGRPLLKPLKEYIK